MQLVNEPEYVGTMEDSGRKLGTLLTVLMNGQKCKKKVQQNKNIPVAN